MRYINAKPLPLPLRVAVYFRMLSDVLRDLRVFFKFFFPDHISFFLFIFLLLSLMLSYIPSSGTFTLLSVQYSVVWNKSGATNKVAVISHKKRQER